MSEAQHSPTPWEVVHQLNTTGVFDVVAPRVHGGIVIATCGGSLDRDCVEGANAEFICRAVNAHESLIAALEDALAAMQAWSDEHDGADPFGLCCPNCDGAVPLPHSLGCRIRAALALAKGEK